MLERIGKTLAGFCKRSYFSYRFCSKTAATFMPITVPDGYPSDLNLEITTACNSHCVFCTHEKLISSGARCSCHMDLTIVDRALETMHELTVKQAVPAGSIRVGLVGLGEPLLHPRFFEIVQHTRQMFPLAMIHTNSNCIALNGNVATRLIDSGIDRIVLSLCFNEPDVYHRQCGHDQYRTVVANIRRFLGLKGNRRPDATLQIFDLGLTSRLYGQFRRQWLPLLNTNDSLAVEPFMPLTAPDRYAGTKPACSQLWTTIMVDVDGNMSPCCLAIWFADHRELHLGTVNDQRGDIMAMVARIRREHLQQCARICRSCAYPTVYRQYCRKFAAALRRSRRHLLQ